MNATRQREEIATENTAIGLEKFVSDKPAGR